MGLLVAAETVPILLVSLFVGVWVDRLRRRPVMLAANLGRAALIGSVPLAAVLGLLRMEQLYLVAFGTGVLSIAFETASPAYLPRLLPEAQLAEAYSALALSESGAEVAGPGLAGALVQRLSAPLALIANAASFLVSAGLLLSIGPAEPRPRPAETRASLAADLRAGLLAVLAGLGRPCAPARCASARPACSSRSAPCCWCCSPPASWASAARWPRRGWWPASGRARPSSGRRCWCPPRC
jgi:MFS family permease